VDPVAGAAMMTTLGLPVLDGIPKIINFAPESVTWAKLALWCDNAGLMRQSDWKNAADAREIAIRALTRFLSSGNWKVLNCGFEFINIDPNAYSDYGSSYDEILVQRGLNARECHLGVMLHPIKPARPIVLKSVLDALNTTCPGLSETVLHWIRQAAWKSIEILDPCRIFYLAQMLYWGGEEDESSYLEESGASEEDVICRKDFIAEAPAWVWNPGEALNPARLRNLKKCTVLSPQIQALIDACLKLSRLNKKAGRSLSHRDGLYDDMLCGVGAALWLTEDEHCLMSRIWDDQMQYLYSGEGFSETYGLDLFPLTEAGFLTWLDEKRMWLAIANQLDTLLSILGELK
jgi:PRTRC genetic system protein F